MKSFSRWGIFCLLLAPALWLRAETIKDLPAPTAYVNDFAGVLDPGVKRRVEALCVAVDRQAHAQIAVVTINTLDNDQPIDEAAVELEEKWKVGAKGTDRGVLMLLVMKPTRGRIEVGYGLEGILNDAKVGDIGRAMAPYSQQGDYNRAISLGVGQLAQIIAADAHVTLTPVMPRPRQAEQPGQTMSLMQVLIVGGVGLLIVILLVSTGNIGILWFLLGMLMGGGRGGGGGGRDDDRGGGGFGGFGGGSSGGGGASGNF